MDEKCKICQHLQYSCTVLLGGYIIKEPYCGVTNNDEYCYEDFYLENEDKQ
jgi:hypothetical protein